jgi:hypothetical protein
MNSLLKSTQLRSCYNNYIKCNNFSEMRHVILDIIKGSVAPTDDDVKCIEERQVGHPLSEIIAVPKIKCKHGYVQAFVQHPINHAKGSVHSGMLRLSCPHLVKAIDEYEKEGAVQSFNNNIVNHSDIQNNFIEIQKKWQNIKSNLSHKDKEYIERLLGPAHTQYFLTSGIIGITENKFDDVKCLHAHLADELLDPNTNKIGATIKTHLLDRQIDINGCSSKLLYYKHII